MDTFLLALQFLTPLPLGRAGEVGEEDLARTVAYFPLVALLQGLVLYLGGLILSGTSLWLGPGLILLLWILVSGALHIDGLADTVDGLLGGRDREEALSIMRKGDIGPFGVVAVVMVLLLKYLSMASLLSEGKRAFLLLAPLVGKAAIVVLNYGNTYVREEGTGKAFVRGATYEGLISNILPSLLLPALFLGGKGLLAAIGAGAFTILFRSYLKRRIGGVTGDTMGGAAEMGETLFLISLAL